MRLKITGRFVTAIVTAGVVPLIVYGSVSIASLRSSTRQTVTDGNLNVARRAAQQIEQYMTANVNVLRAVAAELRNTDLRQWQQDRILKDYVLDFPEFRELTLFAPDASVIATSRIGATTLAPPEDRDLEPRIEPIRVDDDFLPTTTVTIPLSRLGRGNGWLVGELNLEALWRMVDGIRVGAEGFALLVASDGRLIAHGNPDEKPRVASGEPMTGLDLATMGSGGLGGEYPDPRGRTLLGVAAPVPALAWTVVVEQPASEAFVLAEQLGEQLAVIIVIALFFTIGVGYIWGRSLTRPIFSLIRGTEAIAEGRLDERVPVVGTDELAQLGTAFNSMADKLVELQDDVRRQERQAMFGRIAAGLVHDISHPIQNIGNSCKLILKLGDDPEYRQTFQRTVDREFSSIKRVLDDLRNLARPIPLENFPVDVNRAVRDTVESMEPLAETAGLSLDRELSSGPLFIQGDLFALGRVYRNLIVNAIEATSPGGSVTVSTEDLEDRARISVRDTGLGIPAERLGEIFEDFATTKRRGLGLGLAISRKIVEQLGGTIGVSSHVGEGTEFVIEFHKTEARPFPTAAQAG